METPETILDNHRARMDNVHYRQGFIEGRADQRAMRYYDTATARVYADAIIAQANAQTIESRRLCDLGRAAAWMSTSKQ